MGKAPLLDATAQNGIHYSTLSVATWCLQGLAGNLGLFCREKRREICESAEVVCNFSET